MKGGIPTLLSAAVSSITAGAAQPFDTGKLSVPFHTAMMVDEIRWSTIVTTAGADVTPVNGGAIVKCKLQLGDLALTNGHVPIWLFGGTTQDSVEEQGFRPLVATRYYISDFRWKLPRPLYVSPGNAINATLERGADGLSATRVQITYAGRVLPPGTPPPPHLEVPYVSAFIATKGATTGISGTTDLHNPFNKPLHVQKLTGRILNEETANTAIDGDGDGLGSNTFQVRLWNSRNEVLVNDFTQFYHVFDYSRRAWTIGRELPPRDRFILQFAANNVAADRTLMAALVGWRKEALS